MTITDRANFGPTSHQQEAVQKFDRAWQQAQEQAKSAAWDTFGAAHYPFQDPTGFAEAVGDFALDAVKDAADELRETYGAAKQWWNQITSITHTPCEDQWNVIVETALPAAGDALYLLMTPSPEEILENYLQPYPSKTSRRGAKGDRANKRKRSRSGKVRRSWPGVPDVDSWAAAVIPGAAMVKGRKAGAPTRWAFDAIDRLDRVLWWFLVIDVTKTFFNVWSSGMREARFCSQSWMHIFSATGDNPGTGGINPFNIYTQVTKGIDKNVADTSDRWTFVTETGQQAVASGSVNASFTYDIGGASSNPDGGIIPWLKVRYANGTLIQYNATKIPTGETGLHSSSISVNFANALYVSGGAGGGGIGGVDIDSITYTLDIFAN